MVNPDAPTIEDLLLRRGCLVRKGKTLRPTHAGLLLFGLEPQSWVRSAEILAVRYLGNVISDVFTRQTIAGRLPDQIRAAELFITETPLLVFGDRVEIHSPGRLTGHVTLQNLVTERYPRNEAIVQVFSDMGFVERLNHGIDRMLSVARQGQLPMPEFGESEAGFIVTWYVRAST